MSLHASTPADEDEVIGTINTTPLVDVMLVLLIIFLITIPVAIENVPVRLPAERSQPLQTRPENITIAIDADGTLYWNTTPLADQEALVARLREVASRQPQPEVHIRGDQETRYDHINRVVEACQRASIGKVGFILQPPPRG